MPRNYVKKRNSYTDGQVQQALEAYSSGKSILSCAGNFGIPRASLQRLVLEYEAKNDHANGELNSIIVSGCKNHPLLRESLRKSAVIGVHHKRVFNEEQEQALYTYIIDMDKRLMGLSGKELRKLAFDFAVSLKVVNKFDKVTGLAGKDWLAGFMSRHVLSNRKAEPTSAARAYGFNKEDVDLFFTLLAHYCRLHQFLASRIWNVDENGISIVAKSPTRVIATTGKKQVGGKTAAERGENVTATLCMSASGVFMPPMLIFPRKRVDKAEYMKGAPEGSWAEWNSSGWMETPLFTKWLKEFIKFTKASVEDPVLLLLDGHHTHVKNLEVAKLGKENGVIILCFPPHCTHSMQPLDVSFMKPLNTYYAEEIKTFQRSGTMMQMKNIFEVFGKAWTRACVMETA